ncbi:L-lactate utilization/bacilysin biosynthesis transcriptional regulator LutR [Bacillaceae bacterium]
MEYKKIKPRKIYEEVAEQIKQMILRGDLKPGDKLDSVQQLAENFQVGRSAVREALSALRAMGLIEMKQGEGTYVCQYDPRSLVQPISSAVLMNEKDIRELLEVRKILEVGAVGVAAVRWEPADLQPMEEALAEMRAGVGDEELGERADLKFHIAIAHATHNEMLMTLMNSVSEIMGETMRETRRIWLFSRQTTVERLYQEHRAIFEALRQRDVNEAQQRMLTHLVQVEEVLTKYFQQRKPTQA